MTAKLPTIITAKPPRRRSPRKVAQTVQNRPAIVHARKPPRKPYATYKPAERDV